MADFFDGELGNGGPGIGRFDSPFDSEPIGEAIVLLSVSGSEKDTIAPGALTSPRNLLPGTSGFSFLIQSWNLVRSERTQEVVTLAETNHMYTFGRNLPKVTVSGYFINANAAGSGGTPSDAIFEIWENVMRARKCGESNSAKVIVRLKALKETLRCVAESLTLNGNVGQEALIDATLQLTVLNG
jgi:hypothetical protein